MTCCDNFIEIHDVLSKCGKDLISRLGDKYNVIMFFERSQSSSELDETWDLEIIIRSSKGKTYLLHYHTKILFLIDKYIRYLDYPEIFSLSMKEKDTTLAENYLVYNKWWGDRFSFN